MNNREERPDQIPQPRETNPSSEHSSTGTPKPAPPMDPELERLLRRQREALGFT